MGKFRVSLGWFDHTEPLRTSVMQEEHGYRADTSEFRVVQPHRTSSNHCDERGSRLTEKVRVSSGRFDYTEPPRTTVMKEEVGLH